jgi:hypothetical protein
MTDPARNLPAERKPQVMAGGPVAALVPQSLDEAFRVATAIAQSGLAPQGIQRADQIMVAIMAGAELGLAPFQALQSFAVINGRPTLWGDGLVAVARAQGVKIKEWLEGEGDGTVAWCEVTRPDTDETIKRSFSIADAKRANLWGKRGPWTEYPKRMLGMRARAWALRDGCADMLRGFQVREEVEDYGEAKDVTPTRPTTGMRARLEAREASVRDQQGFDPGHVAAETRQEPRREAPAAEAEFSDVTNDVADPRRVEEVMAIRDQDEAEASRPAEGVAGMSQNSASDDAGKRDTPPLQETKPPLPPGLKRGSDLVKPPEPEPLDPMEWKAVAWREISDAADLDTLDGLFAAWTDDGSLARLKAASKTDWRDLCDHGNARKGEIEAEGARG